MDQASQLVNSPWKIVQSITKLILDDFINALVDDDYSGIILEGEPPIEQIEIAWLDLRQQYIDVIGDINSRIRLQLLWETKMLERKLNSITIAIHVLTRLGAPATKHIDGIKEHIEKWTVALNDLLFSTYLFDPEDQENFAKQLQSATDRSKGVILQYQLKKNELEGVEKKMGNRVGEKPTREQFEENLANLSTHYKMDINAKSISTWRYGYLINQTSKLSKRRYGKH